MPSIDIGIIGAGIGGLACAAKLAKEGFEVAIFEKEAEPGGYCRSFTRDGFTFDACVDSVGEFGPGGVIAAILSDLGIYVELVPLNPVRFNIFPDHRVAIPPDSSEYQKILKDLFPDSSSQIETLFKLMNSIYRVSLNSILRKKDFSTEDLKAALPFKAKTVSEVMRDIGLMYPLTSVLSNYCTFLGLSPSDLSFWSLSNLLVSYLNGAVRIKGGIQNLARGLTQSIKGFGGRIVYLNKIDHIGIINNRAVYIMNSSGETFDIGRHLISNIDVLDLFQKRIDKRHLHSDFCSKLKRLHISSSFLIVYIGTSFDFRKFSEYSSIGYFPTYNMENVCFSYTGEDSIGEQNLGIAVPSIDDPDLAPPGKNTMIIHLPVGTKNTALIDKDKGRIADSLIRQCEGLFPGISEKIDTLVIATPLTLERISGNHLGSAYGWEHSPAQMQLMKEINFPFKNMSIVGHWAGLGGGVIPAMLTGYLAAKKIIERENGATGKD
ncbi:MAG: phytoene desaturase family protein [bacterium]